MVGNIFRNLANPSKKIKTVLLGESGVGKTSLRKRYTSDSFRDTELMTIGVEYANTQIPVDQYHKIEVQLYDLAGQEKFNIRKKVIQGAQAGILVFDVSMPETFDAVPKWLNELFDANPKAQIPLLLVGNKIDLKYSRKVPRSKVENFLKELDTNLTSRQIGYVETSAKTGENIDRLFIKLAQVLVTSLNLKF